MKIRSDAARPRSSSRCVPCSCYSSVPAVGWKCQMGTDSAERRPAGCGDCEWNVTNLPASVSESAPRVSANLPRECYMEPPTELEPLYRDPCHCSFSIMIQHVSLLLRRRGCIFASSNRFRRVLVKILKDFLKKSRPKRLILRYQKLDLNSQLSHKGVPTAKSMNIKTRNKVMPLYLAVILSFTEAESYLKYLRINLFGQYFIKVH